MISWFQRSGDAIETVYEKEIAQWEIARGTFRQDWTRPQWCRFQVWLGTGQSVRDAERFWWTRTHQDYALYLVRQGLVSDGE